MAEQVENAVGNKKRKPVPVLNGPAVARLAIVPLRTIFVGFPTPSVVPATNPFHASGTNVPSTAMNLTAQIVTPMGTLTGNLQNIPDFPFTWTYSFNDPIPTGVPLALIVRGTNNLGQTEEVVTPYEEQ